MQGSRRYAAFVAVREIRILPERTIDAWFAARVLAGMPRALLWAPSPPAQSLTGPQPWDFATTPSESELKVFVVETKALLGNEDSPYRPRIQLRVPQLCVLAAIASSSDIPIFYALPSLREESLPVPLYPELPPLRAALRISPPFGNWLGMFSPFMLLGTPRVRDAVIKRRTTVTVNTPDLSSGMTLNSFLTQVRGCKIGKTYDTADSEGPMISYFPTDDEALNNVGNALEDSTDISGLKERLRSYAGEQTSDLHDRDRAWKQNHLARTTWIWVPISPRP